MPEWSLFEALCALPNLPRGKKKKKKKK